MISFTEGSLYKVVFDNKALNIEDTTSENRMKKGEILCGTHFLS